MESVTFKIAPKRCGSCIRQNSDSSNTSSNLPPTPVLGVTGRPKVIRAHSEPTTPKFYSHDEKPALIFKVIFSPFSRSSGVNVDQSFKTLLIAVRLLNSTLTESKRILMWCRLKIVGPTLHQGHPRWSS